MRYMMFIKHAEQEAAVAPPQGLFDAMDKFVAEGRSSGRLVDTGGLSAMKKAKRIRSHDGRLTATDGPFTEAKEIIGGWAIVKVQSADEANEIATEFMEIHRLHWPEFDCTCEFRQIEEP